MFTRVERQDGEIAVFVDQWDEQAIMSEAMLAAADPRFLWREADRVFIQVSNGQAVYRIKPKPRVDDPEASVAEVLGDFLRGAMLVGQLECELEAGYQILQEPTPA